MAAYRFPVMVWQDFEGGFTAALVENEKLAAHADTAADARAQLKEYLSWYLEKNPWDAAPDFLEPTLRWVKIPVRPEYRVGERIYPVGNPLTLNVGAVCGHQEGGLLVCSLPLIGIRFYYYEARALRDLVTHYVQDKLRGLSPQDVSRYLPPPQVALDEVVVSAPRRDPRIRHRPETQTLAQVADPIGMSHMRGQLSRAYERDKEVSDLAGRLSQERTSSILLVGESGAGKTAIVVDAARSIERKKGEDSEVRHRFWLTSAARLIAGMQFLGQWQERCEAVVDDLSRIHGVLCVENVLDLVKMGGDGPLDSIAAFLVPYLQRGELRLIGEATSAELDACRRLLPGFADLLQILKVEDFSRAQALKALDQVAAHLARTHSVVADETVVPQAYQLFARFLPYQVFPGRAAGFLREVFEKGEMERRRHVSREHVLQHFLNQTGLPETLLRDEIPLPADTVVDALRRHVMGQEAACRAAAHVVVTFKAGLNDPERPLAVLLFCGPTGVGKTELARTLSKFLFGHGEQADRLIRLDMSEYNSWGAAERLISTPQGQPSELVNKVRQQPFVVILLDEIEKADPEVFDVLLSAFDEGRLTDRYGRTTNLRSAVIIMTSNLGADQLRPMGLSPRPAADYQGSIMQYFRPEFFNRIDAVVQFLPLEDTVVAAIVEKELRELAAREGLQRHGVALQWTPRLVAWLADVGMDPRFGARPLQRTIEQKVVAPLARYLLDRPAGGGRTLELDVAGHELEITALTGSREMF